MKATSALFNLIHALSRNEKRYVTLFLTSGFYKNNRSSLQLFRAISRQEVFDEAALKKQLGPAVAARMAAEKNKLMDLVLEALLFLYRDTLPERQTARNRWRAWVLFQKGQQAAAWRSFDKTRRQAEMYGQCANLLSLAYNENAMARRSSFAVRPFSEDFHKRDSELLRAISDDLVLHTLFTEAIDIQKRFGSESRDAVSGYRRLMRHPLMAANYKPHTTNARLNQLHIRALYYSMNGRHEPAFKVYSQIAELLEQAGELLAQHYGVYMNVLSNQLMHAVILRRHEDVPALARKTRQVNAGVKKYFHYDTAFNDFAGIALFELIDFRNLHDTHRGPALLAKQEKLFVKYRPQLSDTLVIGYLFVFAAYHFELGNRKTALACFNDLVDNTDTAVGQNFQCMARLVKMLIHFELGHFDLLPSLARSASRLLQKHGRSGEFEKALLQLLGDEKKHDAKAAWVKLLACAKKHAPGNYSYSAWCDYNFEAWITQHLQGDKTSRNGR